jgi:hypothetical protein
MMLPLPSEALWNWAVKAKEALSGREDSLSDAPAATNQPARTRVPVVVAQDI